MAHFIQKARMATPVYPYKRECGLFQVQPSCTFCRPIVTGYKIADRIAYNRNIKLFHQLFYIITETAFITA